MKKRVLFLCTANSSRSQMAEGIVNHFWGDRLEAYSAGTKATSVNSMAVEAMKEIGIDISHHRSKNLSEFDGRHFDDVITLCRDVDKACPLYVGGAKKTHIGFDDPARAEGSREEILREFRRVRDDIREKLTDFFAGEAGGK